MKDFEVNNAMQGLNLTVTLWKLANDTLKGLSVIASRYSRFETCLKLNLLCMIGVGTLKTHTVTAFVELRNSYTLCINNQLLKPKNSRVVNRD